MKKHVWPLLFLAGCALGPDHAAPSVCMPESFRELASAPEEMDLSIWWKQFGDEELDRLIEEALCCNFDLREAISKIEEFRALYRIEQSVLYPQIQANMAAIRSRRSANLGAGIIEDPNVIDPLEPVNLSGPLIQNFFQLGFDATWEIDLWGKNRRRAEAAHFELEASEESALNIQISIISEVARTYIEVRTREAQIASKKEEIERLEGLLELAEARYNAGIASYLDVSRAQALLEASSSSLPPLVEEQRVALHALAVLLGKPPECFALDPGAVPIAKGRIPETLPSTLLCRRPDIRKSERELGAATARIGVAIAELFPSFSLIGSFGVQSNMLDRLFVWPSRYWSIGPTMIWNLFTGGRLISQIKVENERQKQAILFYERTITTALQEVEDSLVGYFQEEKRLENLEENFQAQSVLRDLTLDRYNAGLISFDDVLTAESDLFLAQQEVVLSTGTLMFQLVGLYKALGGGWQCTDSP